ncbi:MAG: hypothetical protein AAF840_12830 [Bacteroidota bacterium]
MFSLRLPSGQDLDLSPGSSITLNLNCPIFDPQRTDRTWAFPLTLPRSPRNEQLLQTSRVDGLRIGDKIPATLYIGGIPFEQGVLKVKKLARKTINVNFGSVALDFTERAEKLQLRDLDLTVKIADPLQPVIFLEANRSIALAAELRIAINGIRYDRPFEQAQEWVDDINAAHPGLLTLTFQVNVLIRVTMNPIDGIEQLFIETQPDLQLNPITNAFPTFLEIVETNYKPEALRINNAFRSLDTESDSSSFRLPSIYAPNLYEDKNTDWAGVANRYDSSNGGYQLSEVPEGSTQGGWSNALLPQPRVAKLLEAALQQIGYQMRGSLAFDAELRQLLIWNNHDINQFIREQGAQFPTSYAVGGVSIFFFDLAWIVPRPSFNLADHTPDISTLQLVLLFAETFAHIISVEQDAVTFTPIKDLLRAAPEDYTDRIDQAYTANFSDRKTPALDYNRQGDENIFPNQLEREILGSGTDLQTYTLPVFSTFEQERTEDGVNQRFPIIDDDGRSEYYDLGNEPRLRFFFHRGLQPAAAAGRVYPQAGHSLIGYSDLLIGKYSMNWLGEGGLYETWWRELVELNQYNRSYQVACRLTVSDLLDIRRWRNVRKYFRTADGTMVGVIRSVRVKITDREIGLATVTFQLESS